MGERPNEVGVPVSDADKLGRALACGRRGCKCGRKSGASWLTHCPAHDDRRPSLSLTDGDGHALFCCHAGCHPDAVIEVLKGRGLWPAAPSRNETRPRKPKPRETRYEVRNAGGELVAVHVRRDLPDGSKAMHWARPDGSLGLDGLPVSAIPLYGSERLPALPDGACVVLVEGEKPCAALTARGTVAVASVTGAASTPGDDALRPLVRFSVLLWPDADNAGRLHMQRIADALVRLRCPDVRLVSPPDGVPKGWDAADFTGMDAELAALVDGAQPCETTPTPDGAEVLDAARAFIRRYVVLSDDQADAVALWAAHTWALDAADATPYLAITSPEKRSGKSRLLESLSLLVARAWFTGRTSPAALYRKIDAEGATLLLDESDAAFGGDKEYSEALRGVLNTGWRRGGKTTACIGQGANITTHDFATFGPKGIAGIGKLPDTVADRAIPIVMKRRAPGERVGRFRWREAEAEAVPLRDRLEAWAAVQMAPLRDARPELPPELDDRAADVWEPLFAIADAVGGDWPATTRRAAVTLMTGEAREDNSLGVRLLGDVRAIFDERRRDRLSTADIVAVLIGDEGAPWGDLRGKPLDARALARMLRKYGVKPRLMRMGEGDTPGRGYRRADFEDAWSRYCLTPGEPLQALQALQTPDTDMAVVTDVTDVTANRGMGDNAQQADLPDACHACGGADFWYTPDGRALCETCHSNPDKTRPANGLRIAPATWPTFHLCCDDDAQPAALATGAFAIGLQSRKSVYENGLPADSESAARCGG